MSNDPGWDGYLKAAMASAEVDAAELGRRSGVNETQISRWRRGIGQPSLENLRRLAPALRKPLLELMVAAGHLTKAEAKLRDLPMPEPPAPVDTAAAIRNDPTLHPEVRKALSTLYDLLRRILPGGSPDRGTVDVATHKVATSKSIAMAREGAREGKRRKGVDGRESGSAHQVDGESSPDGGGSGVGRGPTSQR